MNDSKFESINDYLDKANYSNHFKIPPSLDFFVNCSNLQAWVEHDYDTKLLDYRLSFPILESLAGQGNSFAYQRLKEEILKRYFSGNNNVKRYLESKSYFFDFLTDEEFFSFLPNIEREALIKIKEILSYRNTFNFKIKNGHINSFSIGALDYSLTAKDLINLQREILNFKFLEELKICHMKKKGIFLSEINELTHLTSLVLNGISISQLFNSNKNCFKSLKSLSFYNIPTPYIPRSIHNLINLKDLTVNHCKFKILPDEISTLSNLEFLRIINCKIEALPKKIGNLNNLRELKVANCKITHLPNSIGDLKKLKKVELNGNFLTNLPPNFSKLKNINYLDLSNNKFSEFSKEITSLYQLETLIFTKNQLRSLPEELSNLKKLRFLYLSENDISSISPKISKIEFLEVIYLDRNEISTIPDSFKNFINLKKFNISSNNLKDFPIILCEIPSLEKINVGLNCISQIYDCLKKLPNLKKIYINQTDISPKKINYYKGHFYPIEIKF